MSFLNIGSSPSKVFDGSNQPEGANEDFKMFGCGVTGPGSLFGGADDSSGGSFFSAGLSAGEAGGSIFGSAGSGTPRKSEGQKSAPSIFGLPEDFSSTTPAKKMKPDTLHRQSPWSKSNTAPCGGKGGPSYNTTTTSWGAPPTAGPGMPEGHQTQSYGQNHNTGRQVSGQPKAQMTNQVSPVHTQPLTSSHGFPQAQPQGHSQTQESFIQIPTSAKKQNMASSVQSSVLMEEKATNGIHDAMAIHNAKINEEDDIPADALLKDLIDMQKQQLSEFLPEMRKGEEKSEQILDSARLVLKDVSNYSEKLAGIKQQYCSRLSQVSSFLRMIPKTEN